MVTLSIPAKLSCDEPGCTETQPAHIVLLASGGLGFKPATPGWRVGVSQGGAFVARCTTHATSIVTDQRALSVAREQEH